MAAKRVRKSLPELRAFGPYLLLEMLLPGGTLFALLLWISRRVDLGAMHRFVLRHASDRPAIAAKPHACCRDAVPGGMELRLAAP
jgi:hypothetical protein